MKIKKRNGKLENLDLNKIHKVVFWAVEGISNVSASEVELKASIQFYNGMKSKDIQETLIKSAAELISEEFPNYQYVAGRLINYQLRKEVYGQYEPWHIQKVIDHNIKLGFYDPEILKKYDADEIDRLNGYIKHDRDDTFTYAAMEQFRGKYLCQNKTTGQIYETPQVAYMLIAATLFAEYPKAERMQWVKDYYNAVSNFDISLPTPVMAGVRTPQRQFSSCVLIESDDSLDSISATSSAIVKYVSQKAGIGINAGRIRAVGSPVRRGDTAHTGVVPFLKLFESSVNSCCLRPDTIVEVENGKIRLSDLKVGMKIKSYEDGEITFKEVTDVWETTVPEDDQVRLTFTNGATIHCSKNHPIMVLQDGVVIQKMPNQLNFINDIISENGLTRLFQRLIGCSNDTGYIDITVADSNVFFAASEEDEEMVLTHNSQGGVRKGSATVYFTFWHYEIEDILVLKNNKGTVENRVRHMDYGIQFNRLMYQRLIEGGNITLFSPSDVPGLYDAFFESNEKFEELYVKYENDSKIRKKTVKASELFTAFMQERKDTGRIYLMNVDHANNHGAYMPEVTPIRQSNLCVTGDTKIDILVDGEEHTIEIEKLGEFMDKDVKVKSYDHEGTVEYKTVQAWALTNPDAKLYKVSSDCGEYSVTCTGDHKIWTENRGYVEAKDLTEDDVLLTL